MEDTKRIVVIGATGLIGSTLCKTLQQRGYAIVVFSRNPQTAPARVPGAAEYVMWQPEETGAWAEKIDGADAVVYLAGESIYTFGKRQTRASISNETQNRRRGIGGIVRAMAEARVRPLVFVSASSVGTYGYAGFSDAELTESSPPGTDFWGQDSLSWEESALAAARLGVRTVVMRTGYILDERPKGGLAQQAAQFRRGFGGQVLPGTQWTPWIHIADVAGLFLLALENERAEGPLNGTAPGVVRNREFAETLGKVVGKPAHFPTPGFVLRLGLGIVADTIIHGRRVTPKKALDLGYHFQYPALEAAMRDLLHRESEQARP